MAPIPPESFARALRRLSARELAAFVADLWAARGWETRVEGRTVVASDGEATRRLLVTRRGPLGGTLPGWLHRDPASGERGDADPDAVVVRTIEGEAVDGTRVVDAAELREMALYAVDPGTRAELFGRHLGRAPVVEARSGGDALRSAPVVASVLLLFVAAAVGAVAYDLRDTGTPEPSPGTDGAAGTPTPASTDATTPDAVTGPAGSGGAPNATGGPYPFGASPYGIESAERLARTHALALAPTSYRWRISYREVVDGRPRGFVNETVLVENATVYRSTVAREGDVRFAPLLVPDVSAYANGSVRYDRVDSDGTVWYRRHTLGTGADDRPPFEDDPYDVIDWYLSVQESWLVESTDRNGTRFHRYAGRGDTWPRTTRVRVTATVDEFGVVHRLRRTHRPPDTDAHIVVTFRVTDIGNTTVTPPPWLDAARRATANGTAASSGP